MTTPLPRFLLAAGILLAACVSQPAPAPAPPATTPAAAPVPSLPEAAAALARDLAARIASEDGPDAASDSGPSVPRRIAVMPIPDVAGRESDFSRVLAERLATRLAGTPGLEVVERGRGEFLIQETKLQMSELADPATAVRLGRILGAELLLTGSHEVSGNRVDILARVVEVETHRVVAGAEASARWEPVAPPPPPPLIQELARRLELDVSVVAERKTAAGVQSVTLAEGESLAAGDRFQVRVRPTEECELYVLLAGSSGRIARVYPDPGRAARVPAARTVQVPPPGAKAWFILDATPGTETLVVVAWLPGAAPEVLAQALPALARWDEPAQGKAMLATLADLETLISDRVAFRRRVAGATRGLQVYKREVPTMSASLPDGASMTVTPAVLEGTGVVVKRLRIDHR